MPLVLVATPGASNANAYADVAAATTVASFRVGTDAAKFLALSDNDKKVQCLVSAAVDIDSLGQTREDGYIISFAGERSTATQSMEWPRAGATALPPELIRANIELAFSYAKVFDAGYVGDPLNPDPTTARISRKVVDVLTTEYFEAGPMGTQLERLPGIVQRLLSSLIIYTPIANIYGMGNVIRGS